MALFDAVYGDAYAAVEQVLRQAPLTLRQLRALLGQTLTVDGAMEVEQKLTDGTWPLLQRNADGLYEPTLPVPRAMPLTALELRWLRSLCDDERAPLFLTDAQLTALRDALRDVPPLFEKDEFDRFDSSRGGDAFADPAYREHFHTILRALREGEALSVRYVGSKGKSMALRLTPEKLEYSAKDRRFRLHGYADGVDRTLNLSGIRQIEPDGPAEALPEDLSTLCVEPLIVEIGNERNALARFMLEFSCFKKESTIDPATGTAVAKIWYPVKDETEVLIRILGFGPTVRVTGPKQFVDRIRERIGRQGSL